MAPRKKAEETKTKPSTTPATRRSARMTRSAAKRLNARLTELPTDAGKKRKQRKAEESKKKVKTETVTATSSESQPEVNTMEEEEDEDEDEADEEDAKEESTFTGDGVNKTISVHPYVGEKADSWLVGVASFIKGSYLLHDPGRGCFEIRDEGGETFTSLLNMKRPFPPLKGFDMDKVISNIIDRVKSSTNASD
uniref:Uncharacterized protein n=1 Tax=Salix viminalis TaxID=40686 RepID=A0A6N2N8K1_SALVM